MKTVGNVGRNIFTLVGPKLSSNVNVKFQGPFKMVYSPKGVRKIGLFPIDQYSFAPDSTISERQVVLGKEMSMQWAIAVYY